MNDDKNLFTLLFYMEEKHPIIFNDEHEKIWLNWMIDIATDGKLWDRGGFFKKETMNVVIGHQPASMEIRSLLGYIIVEAKTLSEAEEIALKCPLLKNEGGSVEIKNMYQLF